MILRDKYGYPIEIVKGKYINNFIRRILLTNIKQTLKKRKVTYRELEGLCSKDIWETKQK